MRFADNILELKERNKQITSLSSVSRHYLQKL